MLRDDRETSLRRARGGRNLVPIYVLVKGQFRFGEFTAANRPEPFGQVALRRRYSNATPIRFSLRHTTRHGQWRPSAGTNRVKCAGMPTGLVTSSAAPVADQFLMVQSIAPPPNSIVAAFRTRWRSIARL